MAHALQIFEKVLPPDAFAQTISAVLSVGARLYGRVQHRAGPLDAVTMRDVGVRREYQDYSSSADVPTSAARRLHRIADAARSRLPR